MVIWCCSSIGSDCEGVAEVVLGSGRSGVAASILGIVVVAVVDGATSLVWQIVCEEKYLMHARVKYLQAEPKQESL